MATARIDTVFMPVWQEEAEEKGMERGIVAASSGGWLVGGHGNEEIRSLVYFSK